MLIEREGRNRLGRHTQKAKKVRRAGKVGIGGTGLLNI